KNMKKSFIKTIIFILSCLFLFSSFTACKDDDGKKEKEPYDKTPSEYSVLTGNLLVNEDAIVKWEGRYEYKSDISAVIPETVGGAVLLYNTATGFTVTFTGTSLTVVFLHSAGDIYYNFALDDETLPNPAAGRRFYLPAAEKSSTVTLVSGLTDGEHTVTCLKMSEAADSYTAISRFETDGYFMYRNINEDLDKLKFMFICASGGSGHGSLYYSKEATTGVSRTTENSSSLHSFNYLTARMFGADVEFVGQSGWGVKYPKSVYDILDYTGITPVNTVAGAKNTAKWEWANYVPDIVIFNIGGNDTTASGFDENIYMRTCVDMVEKVHEEYPNAILIWTHTGSKAGKLAVQAFEQSDYIKSGEFLHYCIIPQKGYGVTGWGTHGANDHNSIKTHIDTAAVLSSFIKKLGFETVRKNVTFESQASFIIFAASALDEKPQEEYTDLFVYPNA
ncbi:MAG: hypothetical protein J6Y43_05590, partial [Clostridia bacterium]|nr:hypothetical protein [Clostridia bacterium]